jgi:hypothetical protein
VVAGLLFAAVFVGMVDGAKVAHSGVCWSLDGLLTALLAGMMGAASGCVGSQLHRWLLIPGRLAGRRGYRERTGTES